MIHKMINWLTTVVVLVVVNSVLAASITFNPPANISGDTDIKGGGGGQMFAYTWGGATIVNGVNFAATTVANGAVGPNLMLSTFGGANATVFTINSNAFNTLSSSYSNILRGAVFNGTANTFGTATLSNLVVGHTYLIQLWVGDPRHAATTNRLMDVSSGGPIVRLDFNVGNVGGGVGQYTYATFTADSTTQDILVDSSNVLTPDSGVPQINAIQLRDISGVWSGSTSGSWDDNDNSSQNFSGQNYVAVKAATSDVYFGDKDASGIAVATSTITVGAGGVTGANATFNNNSVNYTFNSADANGIKGAYGVTLTGNGTVTFNGANTYSGNTVLNAGTLILGAPGSIGNSASVVLNGGILDCSGLASLSLGSGQSLRGLGTVRGSVTANSGATINPGGSGNAGTITITNNLTLNGQAMTFDLAFGPAGGDLIAVGNILTVNSTCTISLNYLFGSLAGGTYTLMTFPAIAGAGTFVLDTSYPGVTLNVNPTSVTLTVGGGGGTSGVWTNLAGGSWGTAANWSGNVIATNVDGIADFSTLNVTATPTVTINGIKTIGHLIFGDTVQSHNWSLTTGTNILATSVDSPKIIVNNGQSTTISASLQGAQGFNKLGAGTLTLTGANRLTNGVSVLSGTLALSVANPFGPTTNSSMVPLTLSNTVLSVTVATLLTNNLNVPTGTSNYVSQLLSSAGFYGSGAGPITGGGILTVNAGGQNPRLNGGANHNFTGTLIVNGTGSGGMLFAFDEPPSSPSFGTAGSSNAIYELNGGASTLCYMGTSDWVGGGRTGCTNYLGELRGSARIASNNGRSGTTTLEIGGRNTSSTFSGIIRDNNSGSAATPMIIRKVGAGTLTLAGASTYTGATEVRNGTLAVSGSLASSPITVFSGGTFQLDGVITSTNVNVNTGGKFVVGASASLGSAPISLSGVLDTTPAGGGFSLNTATLWGSGVVTGSVTLAGSSINPGTIGGAGTLSITNGNFSATSGALQFDLSSTPGSGNDLLDINGNMDFSSPGVTISINKLVGTLGGGTYVLARCSGTASGSAANLTLLNAGPLDTLQLAGNELRLIVSPITSLTWIGDNTANLWDIGSSTCWMNGASPATYTEGDAVTFNNSGATNPIVNIPLPVAPAVVNVTGNSNYTFVGTAGIGDGASLVKSGTGTLTVLNTNLFTGNIFINGGTIAVGNAGTNGSFSADITNSAALVITTPLDQVMTNSMRGPGSFTKTGSGQLTLTGNSTMTGPATISAGTLSIGDGVSGAGALGIGLVTNNAMLVINQSGSLSMNNAIRNQGGMANVGSGTVVLGGVLSGNGMLTNTGALELNANNTFAGATYINGGSVMLRNFSGFGSGNVVIDDAGGGVIRMAPVTASTNILPNAIRLPNANTPQFVITDSSLTAMSTVRLTGLISGGAAGTDTSIVNGGGTPAGNPRLTIVLENPANNFTMNPQVTSGCLAFTSDGALGDVNNDIVVSATANFPGAGFTEATDLVGLRFDANNITLNANRSINLVGNERINVQGFNGTISGPITGLGLNKRGAGTLTLNGAGSLTDGTTVTAGTLLINNTWTATTVTVGGGATLGGIGTIQGSVILALGGTLSPGSSIGTLTVTNSVTLVSGTTTLMEINAGTLACDIVTGINSINYGGTLTVNNLGGSFAVGQSFQLFSANNHIGDFAAFNLPSLGISGAQWAWNPATGTLSVVATVATNPTNIVSIVNGSNLELSWPADHIGWRLQVQTNAINVGISTNWSNWPGADTTNFISAPIDRANPTVFFRLIYP